MALNSSREPAIVKANAITAASEATCLLLSVDETVKNPRSDTLKSLKPSNLVQFFCHKSFKVQRLTNFWQVWTGCRPDGRWYARRDGQGKGKTNVNTSPKTAAALISACLVS